MALSALVWCTVGPWAALGALVVLVLDQRLGRDRHVLGTIAVVLFASIPVVWFLGSTLPFAPPVPRIQDNPVAHQLGGLAAWTLVFAAFAGHSSTTKEDHEPTRS